MEKLSKLIYVCFYLLVFTHIVIKADASNIIFEYVDEFPGLACVPNALYNAAKQETKIGLNHPMSELERYNLEIVPLLNSKQFGAIEGISPNFTEYFARHLNLNNFIQIELHKGEVCRSIALDSSNKGEFESMGKLIQELRKLPSGNNDFIDKPTAKALESLGFTENAVELYEEYLDLVDDMPNQTRKAIKALKKYIAKNKDKKRLINFVGLVTHPKGDHAILLSLVIDENENRTIYINDNMNYAQQRGQYPETQSYINWIDKNIR